MPFIRAKGQRSYGKRHKGNEKVPAIIQLALVNSAEPVAPAVELSIVAEDGAAREGKEVPTAEGSYIPLKCTGVKEDLATQTFNVSLITTEDATETVSYISESVGVDVDGGQCSAALDVSGKRSSWFRRNDPKNKDSHGRCSLSNEASNKIVKSRAKQVSEISANGTRGNNPKGTGCDTLASKDNVDDFHKKSEKGDIELPIQQQKNGHKQVKERTDQVPEENHTKPTERDMNASNNTFEKRTRAIGRCGDFSAKNLRIEKNTRNVGSVMKCGPGGTKVESEESKTSMFNTCSFSLRDDENDQGLMNRCTGPVKFKRDQKCFSCLPVHQSSAGMLSELPSLVSGGTAETYPTSGENSWDLSEQNLSAGKKIEPESAAGVWYDAVYALQYVESSLDTSTFWSKKSKRYIPRLECNDIVFGELFLLGRHCDYYEVSAWAERGHTMFSALENGEQQEKNPNQYMLKCLTPDIMPDPETFKLCAIGLAREVKMLSTLNHEYLVGLHGLSSGSISTIFYSGSVQSYFLVLDKMDGTLDELLKSWKEQENTHFQVTCNVIRRKTSRDYYTSYKRSLMQRSLRVATNIAEGMQYLHSHHIAHRDLNSRNIGFCDEKVKILDLQLAREFPPDCDGPKPTGMVGTLGYMAPEVYRCEHYGLGSDVYSFGVLFWEIFSQECPIQTQLAKGNGKPSKGGCDLPIDTSWPPSVKYVMERCLSLEESMRPLFDGILAVLRGDRSVRRNDSEEERYVTQLKEFTT